MRTSLWLGAACVAAQIAIVPGASAAALKVESEKKVTGFTFPESVGCDIANQVLYVGNFGGTELKPAEKDGKGFISKVLLDGKIIEQNVFPKATMNKPKGIFVRGNRLWVTDIDGVWLFDTKTKEGKKLDLPVKFANDPAVIGGALYVSDNRNDMLVRVEPADFLKSKAAPKITTVFSGKGINPNGIWPAKDGSLLMVGFMNKDNPRGIYAIKGAGDPKTLADKVGLLDGLYQLPDGDLLISDWATSSIIRWNAKGDKQTIATGFKGPADFCVMPASKGKGMLIVAPDLPGSEVRFIQLAK